MTNDDAPGGVRRMFQKVVHAIPPGHHIGGQRVAGAMLMLFGERLLKTFEGRKPADEQAPRAPPPACQVLPLTSARQPKPQQLDDVMRAWGSAAANDPPDPHTETRR